MPDSQLVHRNSPLGSLPEGWELVPLAEVTSKIGSGATPTGGESVYLSEGIALIRSQNVHDNEFRFEGLAHIDDEAAAKLSGVTVESGDVLLNITGDSIARCCIVPDAVLPARVNQHVSIIRPTKRLNSVYLQKYLVHPRVKAYMLGHDAGGTRKALTKGHIESFVVPLPPLPIQTAIAHILGTLDDKIELNRRMNETLEAMTRALYQSWFTNFDPVTAKAEGGTPVGMDVKTAALFPDEFEDSEFGPFPEGWALGRLSDIVELIGGGTPKTSVPEYWNGGIPWFSVVDAPRDSDMFVVSTEKTITQAGLDNSSTRLLSPGMTIISARGTVGKCALVATPMAMNQSCYGVQGREGRGNYYTYFTLRNSVDALRRGSHGSIFETITRSTFDSMRIVIPPTPLTQAYDRTVSPWVDLIHANLSQSRTLTDIRDTLLPKLLSGEVQVQEANKAIEVALA